MSKSTHSFSNLHIIKTNIDIFKQKKIVLFSHRMGFAVFGPLTFIMLTQTGSTGTLKTSFMKQFIQSKKLDNIAFTMLLFA